MSKLYNERCFKRNQRANLPTLNCIFSSHALFDDLRSGINFWTLNITTIFFLQWTNNIQNQNPFLTAQSTQIKSVISVPIKRFYLITILGHCLTTYPGSVRTFTTYPGRDALLRHTRVLTTYPGSRLIT